MFENIVIVMMLYEKVFYPCGGLFVCFSPHFHSTKFCVWVFPCDQWLLKHTGALSSPRKMSDGRKCLIP